MAALEFILDSILLLLSPKEAGIIFELLLNYLTPNVTFETEVANEEMQIS